MRDIRISAHAIQRWQQRVDPEATWLTAHVAIRRFLKTSRIRPTPRHWLKRRPTPGTTFAFCAVRPSVCIIVVDSVAVTVVTRGLMSAAPRRVDRLERSAGRRPLRVPPPLSRFLDEDEAA